MQERARQSLHRRAERLKTCEGGDQTARYDEAVSA